jgi:hypothetical protein
MYRGRKLALWVFAAVVAVKILHRAVLQTAFG